MHRGTESVNQGVGLAEQAGSALTQIVESSQKVAQMIQSIAEESGEQSSAAIQISSNMELISTVTTQSAEMTTLSSNISTQLSNSAQELQSHMSQFKV